MKKLLLILITFTSTILVGQNDYNLKYKTADASCMEVLTLIGSDDIEGYPLTIEPILVDSGETMSPLILYIYLNLLSDTIWTVSYKGKTTPMTGVKIESKGRFTTLTIADGTDEYHILNFDSQILMMTDKELVVNNLGEFTRKGLIRLYRN